QQVNFRDVVLAQEQRVPGPELEFAEDDVAGVEFRDVEPVGPRPDGGDGVADGAAPFGHGAPSLAWPPPPGRPPGPLLRPLARLAGRLRDVVDAHRPEERRPAGPAAPLQA